MGVPREAGPPTRPDDGKSARDEDPFLERSRTRAYVIDERVTTDG